MVIQEQSITADVFWDMLPQLDQSQQYELVGGQIVEMPPSSPTNSMMAMSIGRHVGNHVADHDLGYVFGADGGYTLSPGDVRIPDVSFVSKARYPELPLPKHIVGGPDLAVEIVSPSESEHAVLDKAQLYLNAGTKLVWLVYPELKKVYVCRPADDGMLVQTLDVDSTLTGGDVLPGFELPLKKLFGV